MMEGLQKSLLVICLIQITSAQLSLVEERRNDTLCNVKSLAIDCGSSAIAVDSIIFKYSVDCESDCCDYDNNHCSENLEAPERSYVRRECSGKSSCTLDLSDVREFCSLGTQDPSYVTIYYYCIPPDRQISLCSSTTLQSSGLPLYLTSNSYPLVTTGNSTCACSLEVYDCSSSVNLYVIDADLYSDTSSCEQSLEIRDSSNAMLQEIKCESYYGSDITSQTLNKHYMTINFLDNSDDNLEGLFFLGFSASTETSQFILSCSVKSESWCVECNTPSPISDGHIELKTQGDTNYGSRATIVCNDGYETDITEITCLANASWEIASCNAKDCNIPSPISNGHIELKTQGNTNYGSKATIICNNGYETTLPEITCLANTSWEIASCNAKDCGSTFVIANGNASLAIESNSSFGASANVVCDDGFVTTKETILCSGTGSWETSECTKKADGGDSKGDDGEKTDASTEGGGSLKTMEIVGIVLSIAVTVAIIVVIFYFICKHYHNKKVSPSDSEKKEILEEPEPQTLKTSRTFVETNSISRAKLPPITPKDQIKHGPVYIDHDQAHIFALTIHIPFRKPANRLVPITQQNDLDKEG